MDTLKAEQLTGSKWRVLAIPFGGPGGEFHGRDFDGEFFTARTDIKEHWMKERPVVFHHAQDELLDDAELGTEDGLTKEKDGWWGTLWLDRSSQYWARVDAMLRAGKMFGSSGALGHFVRKDAKTGEILRWPHIEQTLTLTPANPLARITASKALEHFTSAGLPLDGLIKSFGESLDAFAADLRPDLPNLGEPTGDLSDGGDDAALARLASALDDLQQLITDHRPS